METCGSNATRNLLTHKICQVATLFTFKEIFGKCYLMICRRVKNYFGGTDNSKIAVSLLTRLFNTTVKFFHSYVYKKVGPYDCTWVEIFLHDTDLVSLFVEAFQTGNASYMNQQL